MKKCINFGIEQKKTLCELMLLTWQRGSLLAWDNTKRLLHKPGPQVSQPMRGHLRHANQWEASSGSYSMWGQLRHINHWEESSQLKENFIRESYRAHISSGQVRQNQLRYADQWEASLGSHPMRGQLRQVNHWEDSSQLKEYFIRESIMEPTSSRARSQVRLDQLRYANQWEASSGSS